MTGYAEHIPGSVEAGGTKLQEVATLDRLKAAKSGWFYDPMTKLWHVKVDFQGAAGMETRFFRLQ